MVNALVVSEKHTTTAFGIGWFIFLPRTFLSTRFAAERKTTITINAGGCA
jgi:hypothetical protein